MNLYGLFLAVGLLAGLFWFLRLAKKLVLPTNLLLEKICLIFIFGIIGARIVYILLYPEHFSTFIDLIAIWQGGLVSFGGILSGFLAATVVFRRPDRSIWLNILAPSFFFGWFFGRLGGFFSQNAVGAPSSFFGFLFYNRVPTQLFESALSLITVIISSYLIKSSTKSNLKNPIVYLSSLIIYFSGRFLIDFWRAEPILIYHLKLGQLASLVVTVWCIIVLIDAVLKNRYN